MSRAMPALLRWSSWGSVLRPQHQSPAAGATMRTASAVGQGQRALSSKADDQQRTAFAYCVEQVRKYDYDNYVWMAQLPKELRPAMFALRAFNIETALVADQVKSKEAPLIQVRYQWWRDGLVSAFRGEAPKHPVLVALQSVHQQMQQQRRAGSASSESKQAATEASSSGSSSTGAGPGAASPAAARMSGGGTGAAAAAASTGPTLKQYHLKRMIDTREQDMLDSQPPLSVEGLEKYAEGTASQLLYLQLGAAGVQSREADHAASHLGKAVGISTLLRGAAFHASQRRSYMPIDLCAKHGVSQEDIYSGQASEGLRDVALAVASVAKGHLDEARALSSRLPRGAAAVLLPSLACEDYLTALEAANFDVFHPSLQPKGKGAAPLSYVLRIKWHMLRGTF